MTNVWRVPFVIGGLARLVIGGGYLFVPEWMGGRLAPRIDGHAGARMNLRGMGGTQAGVALYTLARARSAGERPDCLEPEPAGRWPGPRRQQLPRVARPRRDRCAGRRRHSSQRHRCPVLHRGRRVAAQTLAGPASAARLRTKPRRDPSTRYCCSADSGMSPPWADMPGPASLCAAAGCPRLLPPFP